MIPPGTRVILASVRKPRASGDDPPAVVRKDGVVL